MIDYDKLKFAQELTKEWCVIHKHPAMCGIVYTHNATSYEFNNLRIEGVGYGEVAHGYIQIRYEDIDTLLTQLKIMVARANPSVEKAMRAAVEQDSKGLIND